MNILLNAIFGLWLVLLSPWPGSWTQQNSGQHLDSLKCCQNVDFRDFTSPASIQRHSWLLLVAVNDDAGGSNPLGVGASIISFIKKTANSFGRGLANGIHHASGGGRRRLAPAPARMHRPRPAGGIKKRRNGRKKGRRNGRRRRPGSRRGGGRGQFPYMMEEDPGMDMHGMEPMMGHEGIHDPPVKPKSPEEAAGADNEVGEEEGPLMHEEHGSIPPDGNYPMHNGEMYNGDARNTENLQQSENPHSLDNPVEMEIQDPRHSHYEGHQPENIHPGHGMEQPVNHRHRWPPPRHSGHPDHQMPMTEKSHMPQQRGLSTPNGFLHQLVKSNADHGQRLSSSEQGEKFHNKKRTRTENDHLHNPVNLHDTQWNAHKKPKTPFHSTNGFEPEVGMRQQRPGHYQFPPHSNMSGMHNEFGHRNNPHDHHGFVNENHSTHPKLPPFDPHSHLGRFDSHMPTKDQHGQFLPNHHGHRTQTAHFEPNHEEGQREEEEDDDKAKPMHLDSVEEFRKRQEQKNENELGEEVANKSAGSRDKETEPPASHFGTAFQPPTPGHFSTHLPHQLPNLPHHISSDEDISNHHLTGSNEEKTKMENGSGEERQEDGEVHRGQVRYPANEQNGFPLSGSAIGDENENGPSLLHRSATYNGIDSDRAELPPAMAKSAEQPSRSVELDRDDERHEQHQNQQQTDAHGFPIPTGLPGISGHPGMGGHEMDHRMGGHIEPGSELNNRHGEEEEHEHANQIPPTHLGEQHQQMDAHGFPIPAGFQGIGGHSGMGDPEMSHGMNGHIDPEDQRHEEKEGGEQINRNPSALFGGEQQTNANGFPMPTGLPGIGGHEMNHGMGSPIDPNHMHGERDEPAFRPVHGNMMDQNGQQGVADPSSSHLMGMGDHLSHQNIEPSGHFGEENHNHLMGTNHDHLLKNGQQTEPSGMGMDQMNHQSAYPNQQFPADIHTGMMPNQQNMQPGGWPGVEQPPGQLPHQAIDPLMPHQMDNNLPPYQQQMTPSTHQNLHNQNTLPHHQQQGQNSANWPNQFPHQSSPLHMQPHGQQPPPTLHRPSQSPDHLHSQIPQLQSQIPQQPNQVLPFQTQPGSQTEQYGPPQNHHEGSQQQQHLPHQGQLPPIQQQFPPNNQSLQPQFPQHNPSQLPSSQQQLPHGLHNPTQLPHQQQLPQHHLSQQPHHLNRPIQSQHPFYDPNAAQTLRQPTEMFGQPPFVAPGQQPLLPHNLAHGQGNAADFSPGLDPLNGHHRNAEPAQNFPTVTVHAQPTTPVGQFEKLRSTIPSHLRPQISEPSVGSTNIFRGLDSFGGQHRSQGAGMLPTSHPEDNLHQPAAIHHPLTPIATPNNQHHLGNIQPKHSGQNLHHGGHGHGNQWYGNANGGTGHGNHQAVQPQNFPSQNVGGMTAPTRQWHGGQLGERMQSKSVEMDGSDNMADEQNGDGTHHLNNANSHGHQQIGNQNVTLPSGQPHLNANPPPTVSHQGLPNFQPPSPIHSSSNFNSPPIPVNSNAHLPFAQNPHQHAMTAPNAVHGEHENALPTATAPLSHPYNHEAQKAHDEHLHGGEKGQNLASNIADGKFEKAMVHIGKAQQSITKAVSLLESNEPARNLETGKEKNHHDGLMAHSPETQTPNHVDLPPPPLKSILKKRVANPRPHLKLLDDAKRQRHF